MSSKLKTFSLTIMGLIFPAVSFAIVSSSAASTIYEIIARVYKFLLMISIPIAVIIILWAAYTFLTSSGESEKINQAKKILMWAIIGLIIVILSNGIVSVLGDLLEVKVPIVE